MNIPNRKTIYFFAGLLPIIVVYVFYKVYLLDFIDYYLGVSRLTKHIYVFICILAVYGIGTFCLQKYTVPWMMLIWHFLHVLTISFLVILGLYDRYLQPLSFQLKDIAITLNELLISPTLYVSVVILNLGLKK